MADRMGKRATNLHSQEEADHHNGASHQARPGEFTPWEDIEGGTDCCSTKACTPVVTEQTTVPARGSRRRRGAHRELE